MARTNTRRSTSRPTPSASSRSIVRRVLRPEIVGTVLIVLAAALLFYLLPQLPLGCALGDDVVADSMRDVASVDLILGDLEEDFQTKPGFDAGLLEET